MRTMYLKKYFIILTTVVLTSGSMQSAFGQIDPVTTVFVTPGTRNAAPGTGMNLTLTVDVSNVVNLHSFHVAFSLNNAVIQYVGTTEGPFLRNGGAYSTLYVSSPQATPSVSNVTVDDAILGPYVVSGSGTLFSIRFTAVASGISNVTLTSVDLRDGSNNPISFNLVSGTVSVSSPTQVYVSPTYSSTNTGGYEWGYTAYNSLSTGLAAVSMGGTMNISPAIYNGTFTIAKNVTLRATSGTPEIQNLTQSTASISMGGKFLISGALNITTGTFTTGPTDTVILGSTATLSEPANSPIVGNVRTTRTVAQNVNNAFGGIGVQINAAGGAPGVTTVVRVTGVPQSGGGNVSIKRYFDLSPANNSGLNATLVFHYDDSELNGLSEPGLALFRSTNAGGQWSNEGGTVNTIANTLTRSSVQAMSRWTAGEVSSPLPIQLASFTATVLSQNRVRLDWVTLSELNNYGFEVQKSADLLANYATIPNSFIPGHGTTVEPQYYTFTDETATQGTWYYRLKQIDLDGTIHYTDGIHVGILANATEDVPAEFVLMQNYPNPFNPETQITFSVENSGPATLQIYNIIGQHVATLFEDNAESGRYYTVKLDGAGLASGMYWYRLQSGKKTDLKKMLLVK